MMSGTETSIEKGGAIGLSLDKSLAFEVLADFAIRVELEHHALHLSGLSMTNAIGCQGLEPMTKDVGAIVDGPVGERERESDHRYTKSRVRIRRKMRNTREQTPKRVYKQAPVVVSLTNQIRHWPQHPHAY